MALSRKQLLADIAAITGCRDEAAMKRIGVWLDQTESPDLGPLRQALSNYDTDVEHNWLAHSQNDPSRDVLVGEVRKILA